jgi:hypothetical protein
MIEAGQNIRISRRLFTVAFVVLMGLACHAATAGASYWEEAGLKHRFTYSDPNCTNPVDPINVVWEEEVNAAPENRVTANSVARAIGKHGWPRDEYKSKVFKAARSIGVGDIGYQWIVRSDGSCVRDARQMSTGSPTGSRFHVRLFETSYKGRKFVVGDAHRDQKHEGDGCDTIKIPPFGPTIATYGHVATSFDEARTKMLEDWPGSRGRKDWANTLPMRQCNGQMTHSDGDVLYLGQFRSAAVIRAASVPENVSEPTISGTPRPGNTLSVNPGSWSPTPSGFAYQWCEVNLEDDSCAPIAGATGSSWAPSAGNVGDLVTVSVAPSSGSGEAESSQVVAITNGSTGPTTITQAASEVTGTTARLNAYVNPNGMATTYYFQYGKSGYENTVPAPPGPYVGNEYVWNDISGLKSAAVYHYRVVASSAAGTSFGEDMTFTTLPTPPIVTTNAATERKQTSVKLNASVNPNGEETYYFFEYGKGTDYGNAVPASPGGNVGAGTTALTLGNTASGLEPGITYHYRVVAANESGTTYGEDRTVSTVGPFVEALPPAEVTQTKIAMRARLENGGERGAWYFEYGPTSSYGSKTERGDIPVGVGAEFFVSAAAEGLEVGQTIHYRIVAESSWAETTTYGPDQVATTAWSNEPSTGPASSLADWQEDVACPAAGNCISVGGYINSVTGNRTIAAERWSGTSWSSMALPAPEGTSYLEGVSCPSTTSCMAVGYVVAANQTVRPLIMRWNGSAWSELSSGSGLPAGYDNRLNGVSCATAASCEAVGFSASQSNTEYRALAMHFDGSTWTVRQSANPLTPGGEPAQERNVLESVSCASATFCKAVGSHRSSVGGVALSKPLIENLSGSEWVSENADLAAYTLPNSQEFWLQGVSCPSTSGCMAVGSWRVSGTGDSMSFAQRWTGSQWLNAMVFEVQDQVAELRDVSCSSPTSCRAVGKDGRGMHWSGTQWKLQVPHPPADLDSSKARQLSGVACPTATECHAVGYYTTKAGATQRLTQAWSGIGAVPAAAMGAAQSITQTGATLRGLLNPAGVDASYYFEYGLTTSYGTKTPQQSAGSNNSGPNPNQWSTVQTPVTGLNPGATYHYRLVVTNGASTAYSQDTTFMTKSVLAEMPVTEPFNASTSPISDFANKWAPLQWTGSTRKGKNNANGYGPVDTAANGAYFIPTVTDGGAGLASQVTIATGPGVGGRVSLWLDMISPTTAKYGYELALQETSAGKYTIQLKRWWNNVELLLGSEAGYPVPAGSKVALFDEGTKVAAYVNSGSGFVKVLSGSDISGSGGSGGVEVQGATTTRITDFKIGITNEKAASLDIALKSVPLIDDFLRDENPLSKTSSWSPLAWDTATVKTGKTIAGKGWTPTESTTAVAGAYWQKAMASDTGTGDVVEAAITNHYEYNSCCYFGLWLNAPNPASVKSGYQLRVVGTGFWPLELKLYKWVNGTSTLLGSKTVNYPVGGSAGARFALVDRGGTVSVHYTIPGSSNTEFALGISAADTTYSYGYGGIEGVMPATVRDFRLGQLPLS